MSARARFSNRVRNAGLCFAVIAAGACAETAPEDDDASSGFGSTPPPASAAGTPAAGGAGGATAGAGGADRPATPTAPAGASGTTAGVGGASAGAGGAAGMAAGAGGAAGMGAGGAAGVVAGAGGVAGVVAGAGGAAGAPAGSCCADGDCICRGTPPAMLSSEDGPYATDSYSLAGTGCVYYPTDAEPPFSAVAISDGFGGSGGCGLFAQTSGWGPFLASHGIVTMIVETTGGDQPITRGAKLLEGVEGFKAENMNSSSPIFGKLASRYGTAGFSMGGGGTTHAASQDPTLKSSVGIMAWTPTGLGVTVPTLFTCGTTDALAGCFGHGLPAYNSMPEATPKMIITISSPHVGQPTAGGGMQGAWGLAFMKAFLDGDDRWRPVLLSGQYDDTNIQ